MQTRVFAVLTVHFVQPITDGKVPLKGQGTAEPHYTKAYKAQLNDAGAPRSQYLQHVQQAVHSP